MYNLEEATNPMHIIDKATLLTNGNSYNVAKLYIKAANELIPIM